MLIETPTSLQLKQRKVKRRRFVRGPLEFSWIVEVDRAHPKALVVALAVKMLADITGRQPITLGATSSAGTVIG